MMVYNCTMYAVCIFCKGIDKTSDRTSFVPTSTCEQTLQADIDDETSANLCTLDIATWPRRHHETPCFRHERGHHEFCPKVCLPIWRGMVAATPLFTVLRVHWLDWHTAYTA